MRKFLCCFLLISWSTMIFPVYADTSVVEKYKTYQSQSKNSWATIGLSAIFPSLGHLYAGDWGRGLLFLLADVGGLYLVTKSTEADPTGVNAPRRNELFYYGGLTTIIISRVWEGIDAYCIVKNENQKLKNKLGLDSTASEIEGLLSQYVNENQQYTSGTGIGNTFVGSISKDGLGFPRNVYGFNTLLGYSHTLIYGGQPSVDEVNNAYNKVKTAKSNDEIRQKGLANLVKDELNKSIFPYFEYGSAYFFLPINIYWGQIIMLNENSRIKWGIGLPTLLSLGYSFDF